MHISTYTMVFSAHCKSFVYSVDIMLKNSSLDKLTADTFIHLVTEPVPQSHYVLKNKQIKLPNTLSFFISIQHTYFNHSRTTITLQKFFTAIL